MTECLIYFPGKCVHLYNGRPILPLHVCATQNCSLYPKCPRYKKTVISATEVAGKELLSPGMSKKMASPSPICWGKGTPEVVHHHHHNDDYCNIKEHSKMVCELIQIDVMKWGGSAARKLPSPSGRAIPPN